MRIEMDMCDIPPHLLEFFEPMLKAGELPAKNLIGIPWRLAFALQADGWWLRSDIIFSKPAPMPESVTSRPTRSHEYIFLLAKAERYFYDATAIAEPAAYAPGCGWIDAKQGTYDEATREHHDLRQPQQSFRSIKETRNKRSVWTIGSGGGFNGGHFAVFPSELPTTCIKAGTSERGHCPACNKRWVRIVDRTPADVLSPSSAYGNGAGRNDGGRSMLVGASSTTTGWQAQCACGLDPVPDVVLDCFSGAGTTGLAAERLQRYYIGIELSEVYANMSRVRIVGDAPLFTELVA